MKKQLLYVQIFVCLAILNLHCTRPDNTYPIPDISAVAKVLVNGTPTLVKSGLYQFSGNDTVQITFSVKASSDMVQIDFAYAGDASYTFENATGWYQQRSWIPVVQKRDQFVDPKNEIITVNVFNIKGLFTSTVKVFDKNGLQNNISFSIYRADALDAVNVSLYSQNSHRGDAASTWVNFLSTNKNLTCDTTGNTFKYLSPSLDVAYSIDSISRKGILSTADSASYSLAPGQFKSGKTSPFKNGNGSLSLVKSSLNLTNAAVKDLALTDFTGAKGLVSINSDETYAFKTTDGTLGLVKVNAILSGSVSNLTNAGVNITYKLFKRTIL